MPTLRFVLKGQYITRIDSLAPVAKSRNYFYAHFDFQTPEWTGIKTALFTQGKQTKAAVLDDNNECLIPWEFWDTDRECVGSVSVFCEDLRTANEAFVRILKSGYTKSSTSNPPSPDVYEQLIGIVEDTKEIAQGVRDDADAGKFTGPPGPQGEQGIPGIVLPANGMFAFRILGNNLHLIYNSADKPPAAYINEQGHLIFGTKGDST